MFALELQINEHFKECEIKVIESFKKQFQSEYCQMLKKTIQEESLRVSLDMHNKLNQCQIPSYEDINQLKILEKAKAMII